MENLSGGEDDDGVWQHQQDDSSGNSMINEDPTMMLSQDELEWAHEIKAAIHNSSNIKNLSDYECAQWAIVTLVRQDMDEVLERTYKLQCFVEEHRLHQNPDKSFAEEGLELIQMFFNLMPGYLLSVDYMPSQGHYVLITDESSFTPGNVVSPWDWRALLCSLYFIIQLMNSHLAAVRGGVAIIHECMGMGFHNFSSHLEERIISDFVSYAPLIHKESMWLNSPTAANVLIACLKPFLGDEVYQKVRLGCKLPGFDEKIDTLFKTPTPELANRALLEKIESYLVEREENELNFRLPTLSRPSSS